MSAKTVFMFSGQGSQFFQMGLPLYESHPVFRQWMDRLDQLGRSMGGPRVVEAIYGSAKSEVFDRTLHSHPAIFITEYALAQCLIESGVQPDLTLGASLGSFAAAAVAGHVRVEDALVAVLAQARGFEATCERGGMLAILADPSLFDEGFLNSRSEIAGVNFQGHFVVSALQADLDAVEAELKTRGITSQRLAVSFAYHSKGIEAAQARLLPAMRAVAKRAGPVPVVCCEQAATLPSLPDDFFWRVVRQPIRFRDAITQLEQQGPHRYIDVGPSGTLATFVKYLLPTGSESRGYATMTPYGQELRNLAALAAASQGTSAAAPPVAPGVAAG